MSIIKSNITPMENQDIPESGFNSDIIIVGTCLGSGRLGIPLIFENRIQSYRCKKCNCVFTIEEMAGVQILYLPNH